MKLEILYQDRHMIAVNKPAGIGVGTDDSGDETLLMQVRRWNEARQIEGRKGYCVPIHFLDRPVSGVILFGLSSKGAARLNAQFRDRSIGKSYLAAVEGVPTPREGRLIHPLKKLRDKNLTVITTGSDPEGKLSELSYRVLAERPGYSLVAVVPKTGRSHQIRVQLASLGTPIIGDLKYGARKGWSNRIALHANELSLIHPVEKTRLVITAPEPEEWVSQFGRIDIEA